MSLTVTVDRIACTGRCTWPGPQALTGRLPEETMASIP
jgi:hypothetical protein